MTPERAARPIQAASAAASASIARCSPWRSSNKTPGSWTAGPSHSARISTGPACVMRLTSFIGLPHRYELLVHDRVVVQELDGVHARGGKAAIEELGRHPVMPHGILALA